MLSGCFVSDWSFYSPSEATYPFQNGTHYQHYSSDANGNWTAEETGTLSLANSWYSTTDDKGTLSKPFIVKNWGNYLIVEAQDGGGSHYIYDLLQQDGNTIYEYNLSCDDDNSDQLKSQGLISDVQTDDDGFSNCKVVNPTALETIFQHRIDGGAKPDSKYVLQ